MKCPHCDCHSITFNSNRLNKLATEKYYECSNIQCMHKFIAITTIKATISPSKNPDLMLDIPLLISQ